MIFSVPESQMKHHGMDMSSHYLGMWFNFLISSFVLTTSVAYIAQRMRKKDVELSFMREAQLRQEQLLAHAKSQRSSLTLSVYKENVASYNFYRSQAFTVVSEQVDKHTGHQEYTMSTDT
ncbi:MAG: hypothetical protein ACI8SJ_002753 [Shewanella sp.]|jgi:hypothetical protein